MAVREPGWIPEAPGKWKMEKEDGKRRWKKKMKRTVMTTANA